MISTRPDPQDAAFPDLGPEDFDRETPFWLDESEEPCVVVDEVPTQRSSHSARFSLQTDEFTYSLIPDLVCEDDPIAVAATDEPLQIESNAAAAAAAPAVAPQSADPVTASADVPRQHARVADPAEQSVDQPDRQPPVEDMENRQGVKHERQVCDVPAPAAVLLPSAASAIPAENSSSEIPAASVTSTLKSEVDNVAGPSITQPSRPRSRALKRLTPKKRSQAERKHIKSANVSDDAPGERIPLDVDLKPAPEESPEPAPLIKHEETVVAPKLEGQSPLSASVIDTLPEPVRSSEWNAKSARIPDVGGFHPPYCSQSSEQTMKAEQASSVAPADEGNAEPIVDENLLSGRSERKRTSRALPGTAGRLSFSLVEPPPPELESYRDWFKRVVIRNRWMTWFTTFYVHWMLILALAAIIVHGPENTANLLINAAFAVEEDVEAPPFEIIPAEPEALPVTEPEPLPEEDVPTEMLEKNLQIDDVVLTELAPEILPNSDDAASAEVTTSEVNPVVETPLERMNPSPPQAVHEGSFSVWTEPANPRPGEPYKIIIQVRLPEKIQTYSISDLQGVVVGSDGYRKPIPGFMQGDLPIVDGYARLAVPIVSADKKVCDTVFIRSALLRETQKLQIEFH